MGFDPVAEDEIDGCTPPSALRVAQRALTLWALVTRAHQEGAVLTKDKASSLHLSLIDWVSEQGILEEFEPQELELLRRPVGTASQREILNASWRVEGLAVLAWALNLIEKPVYDQPVDPDIVLQKVAQSAKTILASPIVRDPEELDAYGEELFALHWRLRNFSINSLALDFAQVAESNWFLPSDISSLKLIDGDLALNGVNLSKASAEAFNSAMSCAQERDLAIRWLLGSEEFYSEVDTST